jgi:hypothetical protein
MVHPQSLVVAGGNLLWAYQLNQLVMRVSDGFQELFPGAAAAERAKSELEDVRRQHPFLEPHANL